MPGRFPGGLSFNFEHDERNGSAVNPLEKSPYQRDISRAGHQERDGER